MASALEAQSIEWISPDDLLGLGERPVGDDALAVAHAHGAGRIGGPAAALPSTKMPSSRIASE